MRATIAPGFGGVAEVGATGYACRRVRTIRTGHPL